MRPPRRTSAASRGAESTACAMRPSLYSSAPLRTCVGGVTSSPKTSTPSRLKPRSGPNPSPCRLATCTACAQSGSTPSSRARIGKRLPAAVKTSAASARRAERRSRSALASFVFIPPTSMPSIETPFAIVDGDPAKARPRRTAIAASPTYKIFRPTTCRVPAASFTNTTSPPRTCAAAARPPPASQAREARICEQESGAQRNGAKQLKHEQFHAAAHVQLGAGDEAREVGAEEGDDVRDLLRVARPLQ